MRKLLLLLILLLVLAGCCVSKPAGVPEKHCQVTAYHLDPRFTKQEAADINAAANMWNSGTFGQACLQEVNQPEIFQIAILKATNQADIGLWYPAPTQTAALYWRYLVVILVDGNNKVFDLAAHEFGHVLGLEHNETTEPSFMHASGPVPANTTKLPAADLAAFIGNRK